MKRAVYSNPIGDGMTRHRVVITDEPNPGYDRRRQQLEFLMTLVNDGVYSGLLNCGPVAFETLKMKHDGSAWMVELEAVEEGRAA